MKDKICIIGLGYDGLPLAHAFSKKYKVVGLDIYKAIIDELNRIYDRAFELNKTQFQVSLDNNIKFICNIKNY